MFEIEGGDYAAGGAATRQLKGMLKKLGIAPEPIRRTMIAAYEAEMNVVIHAHRGFMRVAVDPTQVDVAIEDEGPGIPDIGQAMREGFSTAPSQARELGFGAGMGLPNIRRNSDRFSLRSSVGEGTQVRFSVFVQPLDAPAAAPNSLHITEGLCRQCLLCLRACPTGALRIRGGEPRLFDHLCVDCTACIQVCCTEALSMGKDELPSPCEDTVLVLPGAFLDQFGASVQPEDVFAACRELGFTKVRITDEWEQGLRAAALTYAQGRARTLPVLSPACPAALSLVQLRFPSLLDQVAPFLTPLEAAREEIETPHAVFVVSCPAQRTSLRHPGLLTRMDVIEPSALCGAVLRHVRSGAAAREERPDAPASGSQGILRVSGASHVARVLDAIENGRAPDCQVVELYMCDQGCAGSPVWTEDPFVAIRHHEQSVALARGDRKGAVSRVSAPSPRAGLRLDADMRKAMEKLSRIDALTKTLPGRDCGVCGAPTCAALAEDIVLGEADVSACIYNEASSREVDA